MDPIKQIRSRTVVLPMEDIDTDQIIPARFLTTTTKTGLGERLFTDWRYAPDGSPREDFVLNTPAANGAAIMVAGRNFGCGSSREHAPWVFEVNDINVVIASGFARIFRQNMFNCGMLAIELSESAIRTLFAHRGGETTIDVDFTHDKLTVGSPKGKETVGYTISAFDKALVEAGGWVEFADSKY